LVKCLVCFRKKFSLSTYPIFISWHPFNIIINRWHRKYCKTKMIIDPFFLLWKRTTSTYITISTPIMKIIRLIIPSFSLICCITYYFWSSDRSYSYSPLPITYFWRLCRNRSEGLFWIFWWRILISRTWRSLRRIIWRSLRRSWCCRKTWRWSNLKHHSLHYHLCWVLQNLEEEVHRKKLWVLHVHHNDNMPVYLD